MIYEEFVGRRWRGVPVGLEIIKEERRRQRGAAH